ncbi:MAG TPA: FAD-dependent oxidoreductase [Acidimicrobiia bacterium]|nr:FAD-dependent oxidoreductase [Acidimicrobiia bacterium]
MDPRTLSYWHDSSGDDFAPRAPLAHDLDVDVAIVGAGYTGLWTAYSLHRIDPTLRIVVLEREVAGFGASGRNGGWCSALFAGSREHMARAHSRDAVVRLQRAMFATVDEVGRVAREEGIDCHYAKGGTLSFATRPAHEARLRAQLADERAWGFGPDDIDWLDADEVATRAGVPSRGGLYTPHCAAIHPARLVRGLARVVEARGVPIHEGTPVLELGPGRLRTPGATVRAEVIVRATEAFTAALPGERRTVVPVYSLMIATEPLDDDFWASAGLHARETFTDGRHLLVYGQRTADGRFAFGGRGAPYHFGSRLDASFDRHTGVFEGLRTTLRSLFPQLGDVQITHRWGGAVAVPRDWHASCGYDRARGFAWAGGYVGDGVGTANLAGRTLADLIVGRATDLVDLPWVGHRSRRWEPEPLRWAGINLGVRLAQSADRAEEAGREPRVRGWLFDHLLGH